MKTVSFGIANYCVPCHAYCRYCLLSSCGKATGVNADEGMGFARRVMQELAQTTPDLSTFYYIGYCMDTPDHPGYIQFCREHHSPGAGFPFVIRLYISVFVEGDGKFRKRDIAIVFRF